MKTRTYLLATVSSLAMMNVAFAADLAPKPIYKAPPPIPVSTWTGFYAGVHAGVISGHSKVVTIDEVGICGDVNGGTCSYNDIGAILGGQIGYNWQTANWVWGLEADASWTSLSKKFTEPTEGGVIQSKVDFLATFRGRLGVTFNDNMTLLYGTGGLAVAHVKSGWGRGYNGPPSCVCDLTADKTRVGWTAGGGIEHRFSPNWSAKLEALYVDLERARSSFTSGLVYTTEFRNQFVVGRVGLNWKW